MSSKLELSVHNHQSAIKISSPLIRRLKNAARDAIPRVLAAAVTPASALSALDEIEVSLLDDATIADVHIRFMDMVGPTDVITFDHGEIHISVETAQCQALDFANSFERELMLYIIHGLLHLAGHEDESNEGWSKMDILQQEILSQVWE